MEKILQLNDEIDKNILKGISFKDKKLEKDFQEKNNSGIYFIVSNLVILLGHIATLPYILFAFYKLSYLILFFIGFIISLISAICAYKINRRKVYYLNSHLQIFLVYFLVIKGFLLLFYYHNPNENDKIEEMIRIIIYHFVSTGIFLLINIESNIFIYLTYFLINSSLVICSQCIFTKNRFLVLEGLTSFCLFAIFFFIRREWDLKIRIIYGEKRKFEKLYIYVYDYINGLTGYNINFQNKKLAFYGVKSHNYLEFLAKENFIEKEEEIEKEEKFDVLKGLNPKSIKNYMQSEDMENSLCSKFFKELNLYGFEKDSENPYNNNHNKNDIIINGK
jgi:hypothetical protein